MPPKKVVNEAKSITIEGIKYIVGKELGKGTFGRVCQGTDPKGRSVAIKFLFAGPTVTAATIVEEAAQQARAAALGIAPMVRGVDGGRYVMVMDLIPKDYFSLQDTPLIAIKGEKYPDLNLEYQLALLRALALLQKSDIFYPDENFIDNVFFFKIPVPDSVAILIDYGVLKRTGNNWSTLLHFYIRSACTCRALCGVLHTHPIWFGLNSKDKEWAEFEEVYTDTQVSDYLFTFTKEFEEEVARILDTVKPDKITPEKVAKPIAEKVKVIKLSGVETCACGAPTKKGTACKNPVKTVGKHCHLHK